MSATAVYDALSAWRDAERHWESTDPSDRNYRAASVEVVWAWLAYHEATEEPGTFVMIVDDQQCYVAVSRGVVDILGYTPEELVGERIENVVAASHEQSLTDWDRFLTDGQQEGEYSLLNRDGLEVGVRYKARAHHPIPGFHLSRLQPTG